MPSKEVFSSESTCALQAAVWFLFSVRSLMPLEVFMAGKASTASVAMMRFGRGSPAGHALSGTRKAVSGRLGKVQLGEGNAHRTWPGVSIIASAFWQSPFALELEKMGDQHPHMGEPSGSPCVESPTEVERRVTTE